MCKMCEGATHEQMMDELDQLIRRHGYTVQLVTARAPWAYTIGVLETFGAPELIVTDLKDDALYKVLHTVVACIADVGGPLEPDEIDEIGVTLLDVHPSHLDTSLFASWVARYGRAPVPGEFQQVLPPPGMFCTYHGRHQRRLDRPGTSPDDDGHRSSARVGRRRVRR